MMKIETNRQEFKEKLTDNLEREVENLAGGTLTPYYIR
jgi:hypothetical protein